MPEVDSIKARKTQKKIKKTPPIKRKKIELNHGKKAQIMWLLVGIFSALFLGVFAYSLKVQISGPGGAGSIKQIFVNAYQSKNFLTNKFESLKNLLAKETPSSLTTLEADDKTTGEWEEKLFPEFK